MKFYLTLLLTFLVEARILETDEQVVQRVCEGKLSFITLDLGNVASGKKTNPFVEENNVKLCRELTESEIFSTMTMKRDDAPEDVLSPDATQYSSARINDISSILKAPSFYDGFSLKISSLDEAHVGRLFAEIPEKTEVALDLEFKLWKKVKKFDQATPKED
ncbi:hypothetical protein DSO57_1038836 [Entomophthora muscae]|uniref:Uncharacterized protein n=1 Tax=Entomophthora muscae TaxID=34485 RepID=A0ACC2SYK5_9FUNG|nr:hypothetical protein DSO57_1038836 [Entomophthora muscae]